jgi:hypothetical protein
MQDDDRTLDALDRALFALSLEEPPADLRSSILLATAYRPVSPFPFWEIAAAGAAGAVAVWLVVLLVMGGGSLFTHTLEAIATTASGAITNVATALWVAVGAATALCVSLFTGFQPVLDVAHRSGARNLR